MSNRSREAQRRAETKKRNRRIAAGGVGVVATVSGLLIGGKMLGGSSGEASSRMPDRVAQLIEDSVITSSFKGELLALEDYRKIASREVNGRNIKIAQLGGESTKFLDPELILKTYETISRFIDGNPKPFKTNLTRYDGTTLTQLGVVQPEVRLEPTNKDVQVLEIPGDDTGTGRPNIFTDTSGNPALTFLGPMPDSTKALLVVSVEACQGLIGAHFTDETFIDEAIVNRDRVTVVGQEQVCNAVGVALASRISGMPYEDYVMFMQGQENVTSTDFEDAPIGFAGQVPYVNSIEVYQALGETIPQDFFQNLTFPPIK